MMVYHFDPLAGFSKDRIPHFMELHNEPITNFELNKFQLITSNVVAGDGTTMRLFKREISDKVLTDLAKEHPSYHNLEEQEEIVSEWIVQFDGPNYNFFVIYTRSLENFFALQERMESFIKNLANTRIIEGLELNLVNEHGNG